MTENTHVIKTGKEKKSFGQWASDNSMWVILIGLIIIMCIATLIKGGAFFLTYTNISNIFQSEVGPGLLAMGVMFVIISKGIDLSMGSVVSLASVVSGAFAQDVAYSARIFESGLVVHGFFALLIGLAVGCLIGLINGSLVAYTKIHPFIATLGTMSAGRGFALLFTQGNPVSQLNKDFTQFGATNYLGGKLHSNVLIFILIALIAWFILNQTRFGRNIYAIGGNQEAARVAGVKVEKNLVAIYAWCGTMCGLAAVLTAGRTGSANPTLGLNWELDGIAAATIGGISQNGGVGKVSGCIAGILILGILKSALIYLGVSSYYQEIVKGIIIVVAVVLDNRKMMGKQA
ncbi:MAG TPA: ABC transporter permease [Clostridiaceae bacterium]|nr:ABC transporter permease [Clostridiaceae bacterium]